MSEWKEHAELIELAERLIEERISPEQLARVQELIRSDVTARRVFLQYLDLHGSLHWDTAKGADSSEEAAATRAPLDTVRITSAPPQTASAGRFRTSRWIAGATAAVLVLAGWFTWRLAPIEHAERAVARPDETSGTSSGDATVKSGSPSTPEMTDREPSTSIVLNNNQSPPTSVEPNSNAVNAQSTQVASQSPETNSVVPNGIGDSQDDVVAYINEQFRQTWTDNEVQPSPVADDSEWLRRIYLDTVGHIPTGDQVKAFLADKRADKRRKVVDELLDHEDYIRNWTTIWGNLLVGRSNPREVNRGALNKFLRDAFRRNRGWDDVVADIVSAEGSPEENGAANFLLAHLNNQAVPATAITAKLFLCQQVQCTQCHDHPFNDSRQDEFWSFNSFFKEVKVLERPRADNPQKKERVLANVRLDGPTYYETRNGVLKATFPQYEGSRINVESATDLRSELARLMSEGDAPQMAKAFVNRMWRHFLGAAFTSQVDDMGPHARISHPQVVDRLTREFVRSGFDVKQLVRWITRSEPYQLSSRLTKSNEVDDPSLGNEPLFSRAYVKSMTVEQVFDSLLVATEAREVFGSNWETVEKKRTEWLQQFVQAFHTDENDEADLFDGTIPQALMLMNGDLIQLALQNRRGTTLERIAHARQTDDAKIEAVALATLSRKPTAQEIAAVKKLSREHAQRMKSNDASNSMTASLQDLFWAYLNSNEFILIH